MKDNVEFLVKPSYDSDSDALFISRTDIYDYYESVELTEGVILDFDKKGKASALEILNASKIFNTSKYSLKNIKNISMQIAVLEKSIHLNLSMGVLVHNKELRKSLDESTINDINAPIMETELATA